VTFNELKKLVTTVNEPESPMSLSPLGTFLVLS